MQMMNVSRFRILSLMAVISAMPGNIVPAYAHSDGQVMASGKNSGFYCRSCHAAGTAPTVAIEGPGAVGFNAITTFRFVVTSQGATQIAAGLDVAADGGVLGLVADQGTRLQGGEVTHTEPKANDANRQATFEFTWQAPATAGTYTLYAAGCSVDGNLQQSGDAAARVTFAVVVGATTPTPTPTPTVTPGPGECAGDCNGDGAVSVAELITGVNIALGSFATSACSAVDANGNGEVGIDELVKAVNKALEGC